MERPRARRLGGLAGLGGLAAIAGMLACAGPALATATTQTISSPGPVTGIDIGNDLDCQVAHAGWSGGAFYPSGSLGYAPPTGDCGTFVSVGANVYGPDFLENYASGTTISLTTDDNYIAYTPGAQSAVTGAGTAASPYAVTTSATAGSSGIAVSESDRHVTGNDGYTTAITLTNTTGATVSGVVYRAVDCYLQGSDDGYGDAEVDGAVACSSSTDDTSGGPFEELDPVTAASRYVEGYYNDLWGDIDAQTGFPDTCDCTIDEDNAIGLSWDFALAPGASAQYTVRMNFVPTSPSASGPGSGTGSGPSSGQGKESARHKVRITLRQSARHHRTRRSMSLPAGFRGERVRATLHGTGVRAATGTISYRLYRGRRCTASHRVLKGKRQMLRHGKVPASRRVTRALRPGRYTWQAIYSGNRTLQRARSVCGGSKLIILK